MLTQYGVHVVEQGTSRDEPPSLGNSSHAPPNRRPAAKNRPRVSVLPPSVNDMTATTVLELPAASRAWLRYRARLSATRLLHWDAVIVDVETTDLDGRICEIAIIDTTGRVLLDTLVNPECPIAPAAEAIHGITDAKVETAPTWGQIAGCVQWLLSGRRVTAYNAPFDQGIIHRELERVGRDRAIGMRRWSCLMRSRSAVEGRPWQALEGGHRALGDCLAALAVLEELAIWRAGRPRTQKDWSDRPRPKHRRRRSSPARRKPRGNRRGGLGEGQNGQVRQQASAVHPAKELTGSSQMRV